ncbi:MAG: hypothetical protein ACJA1L_000733, partial [Paracoccaceae bacterium]
KTPLIHRETFIRATKAVNRNAPEMGRFLRVSSCPNPWLRKLRPALAMSSFGKNRSLASA